jgi:predicted molibdopterin-dependent oxidoreductase YjgC
LEARDGRLVGVAPSENHPVSRGRLCARGWNAHEAPAWGKRLTQPLVRRRGTLVPAAWSEALDEAASSLSKMTSSGRAAGVLGSARATNEENYLAARLARRALHTNRIDSCLRSTWLPFPVRGTFDDVERSDAILVVEGDLVRSHPVAAHAVMLAVKRGAKLVTIGHRRTQVARLAALHLPVAPGGREQALCDLATAERTGDGPLAQAAAWYAGSARASILFAPGSLDSARAAREAAAIARLASTTGHLERAGSALLYLAARGNLRGACEMGIVPDPADGAPASPAPRNVSAGDARPPVETIIREADALVIVADDPPAILANGPLALATLQAKECLIVLDAFMTPTVEAAHVALPIASFAENDGTTTNLEGRVQRVRAAVPAPGDARPAWEVLVELSTRLGLPSTYRSPKDVLQEIAGVAKDYAAAAAALERDVFGTLLPARRDGFDAGGVPDPKDAEPGPRPDGTTATLALDGIFDWGSDPLFEHSPTLSREHRSRRRLFPRGQVEMNKHDADDIGVRPGWMVRITSVHGEAALPVSVRDDIERGVLLVPYAFRGPVEPVLGGEAEVAVRVEKSS